MYSFYILFVCLHPIFDEQKSVSETFCRNGIWSALHCYQNEIQLDRAYIETDLYVKFNYYLPSMAVSFENDYNTYLEHKFLYWNSLFIRSLLISRRSCFIISERVYKDTLQSVKQSFPQYVRELEGVADGAQVEFHKVLWRRKEMEWYILLKRWKYE